MKEMLPQEIAVWYVIPSIRKELSKELLAKGLNQKKAAALLGLTEAAISQYVSQKRAGELQFGKEAREKIKKAAAKILKDEKNTKKYIYKLTNELMKSKEVCKLHFSQDKGLDRKCNICFN